MWGTWGTMSPRSPSLTYVIGLRAATTWNHRRWSSDGHGYWLQPVKISGVSTRAKVTLIRLGGT